MFPNRSVLYCHSAASATDTEAYCHTVPTTFSFPPLLCYVDRGHHEVVRLYTI
jgi:hypothetical protein